MGYDSMNITYTPEINEFIDYLESKGITIRDFIKNNSEFHYKDIRDSKEYKEWFMNKKLTELENDFIN